jgi:hypothetical protein
MRSGPTFLSETARNTDISGNPWDGENVCNLLMHWREQIMTNTNAIAWGALRQRDVRVGLGYFIGLNLGLFALIVLGADVLGHDGSHDAKVSVAAFAVLANFMLWLWNDSGARDVQAGNKDIADEDADTHIGKNFKAAPFGAYRALIAVVSVVTTLAVLYALLW